ncbi:hypothetical protein E4U42_006297 [Claviceps africana]|uniref:FAD-dependent urate hydroxylase HpyO/Asp monooxygenase CreE-like FAD/NAD(P)-binding domain-containing protein n=1 Tax=Claviceps africana TaxID=83212 RepID=A0A8K0NKA8_9HYPO|nr:hypothetical protein E4U42_006297 [Claviceps africana]
MKLLNSTHELPLDLSRFEARHPYRRESHIAIVGAGPRGTSTLERICSSASQFSGWHTHITVHVIDPWSPGAGKVWRTEQSPQLLMNTVTSQITLFTDKSVACDGPIRPGPSLYDWAKTAEADLGPNDYSTRAHYGRYLEWVFAEIVRTAPRHVTILVHKAQAVRLDDATDGSQTITLSTGKVLSRLAAVVLAQGHLPLRLDLQLQQFAKFALGHKLRYIPPSNPADTDLSGIQPGEEVILRGLGLNFFDYVTLLTTGRGGRFTRSAGKGMVYIPSGTEPRMYAGSRRGIPYHARGDNEKGVFGRHEPAVLTAELIDELRQQAKTTKAPDFKRDIWPHICKEVELVYYEALLCKRQHEQSPKTAPVHFRAHFLSTSHGSHQEEQVLELFNISKAERWSWERLQHPQGSRVFGNQSQWREWLLEYLQKDAAEAIIGNISSPIKAALDVLRDLRNEIRLIVDHNGVEGSSYRDHLDQWYTPLNAFLSIGPPRQRIEEMIALMESGILDVLGPRIHVAAQDECWTAHSRDMENSEVHAHTLIEARLPHTSLRQTSDNLLAYLFKSGQCRPHVLDGYETGAMDITTSPYRTVDMQGNIHERRFALGVPTEGVHWVTAAGARPGVNSVTLADADAVARAALRVTLS